MGLRIEINQSKHVMSLCYREEISGPCRVPTLFNLCDAAFPPAITLHELGSRKHFNEAVYSCCSRAKPRIIV